MRPLRFIFISVVLAWRNDTHKPSPTCRCLPSDDCWPSSKAWKALNATVDGQLIKTVPLGSPCHDPTYDEEACLQVRKRWNDPRLHLTSSSGIMQHYFVGQSCSPFAPRSEPCALGNYVAYAIKVTKPEDVVAGIKFAKTNNIRVVIRNTGHDYLGRSTGAGALAIWTHQLNSTETISYCSPSYTGPALIAGAGVQGFAALEAANAADLHVVGGTCPSVGFVGGFLQGGGHSALSTSYGLAADQALRYKVVTANGDVVTASAEENKDLFWALSGGGGGNYGVVLEATVRAYPAAPVGGARIRFAANSTSKANFASVVSMLHEMLPSLADQDITSNYLLNGQFFSVGPFTMVNSNGDYLRERALSPFTDYLKALNIPFQEKYTTLSYRDHFDTYLGPLPWGSLSSSNFQYGSRLIPRTAIEENNGEFQRVITQLISSGVFLVATNGNFVPSHPVNNSVNPAWRSAMMQLQVSTPWSNHPEDWDNMVEDQKKISEEYLTMLKNAAPGGASYLNEADIREPDWKSEHFGSNYKKLLRTKYTWDPDGLFYIFKGVGSEAWTVDDDGRMCRSMKQEPLFP